MKKTLTKMWMRVTKKVYLRHDCEAYFNDMLTLRVLMQRFAHHRL